MHAKTIHKKGVGQLYSVIQRFLQGEAVHCVDTSTTIQLNQVRMIRPIIAFMDGPFLSPGINGYINNTSPLRPRRRGSGVTVTPTFTLSIADLEYYVRASADVRLATALQAAYDNNKPMDGGLGLMDVPALRSAHFADTPVQKEFEHFDAEMTELFFGTHEAD